jgi:hypothetical protein
VPVDIAVEIHGAEIAAVSLIFQREPERHYAVHELIVRLPRQSLKAHNICTGHCASQSMPLIRNFAGTRRCAFPDTATQPSEAETINYDNPERVPELGFF